MERSEHKFMAEILHFVQNRPRVLSEAKDELTQPLHARAGLIRTATYVYSLRSFHKLRAH